MTTEFLCKQARAMAIVIFALMPFLLASQTMKLIPLTTNLYKDACKVDHGKKYLCYVLEYTPEVSGTLTSYTTAFFVTCTSKGPAVTKNESCSMINNVNVIDGCGINGTVLVNSSGNSGTVANNVVTAGKPVILHQICFSIPGTESITVTEDPVTDLTTSIDLGNGESVTEYPSFGQMIIQRERPDIVKPLWLDFKSNTAGDLVAQLDWTTSEESNNAYFLIERSADGIDFMEIGKVAASDKPGRINSYQFFDRQAIVGKNYYRLQQVANDGSIKYSPVRLVNFLEKPLTVQVSPNPADDFIMINIQSPSDISWIKLMDASGRMVVEESNQSRHLQTRLDVKKLTAGMYTLIVEAGDETYTEKIVISHD